MVFVQGSAAEQHRFRHLIFHEINYSPHIVPTHLLLDEHLVFYSICQVWWWLGLQRVAVYHRCFLSEWNPIMDGGFRLVRISAILIQIISCKDDYLTMNRSFTYPVWKATDTGFGKKRNTFAFQGSNHQGDMKVNGWYGSCVMEPVFSSDKMNSVDYLGMLKERLCDCPETLPISYLVESPDTARRDITIKHSCRRPFRRNLSAAINRRERTVGVANSLAGLDFFRWDYVKRRTHQTERNKLDELKM